MPEVESTPTPQDGVVEEHVETPPEQTPEETPAESPTEETPPETPSEEEVPVAPTEGKKWTLKVDGQDVEVQDEQELLTLAQKGLGADRRFQSVSEWEKANQQKLQLADQFLSNPNAVKFAIAQQLGYDPNMVLGNVQPPDPNTREMYPEEYGRRQAYYELAQQQKAQFDNALSGIITLNAQSANNAVFSKTRLKYNLTDAQDQNLRNFIQTRFRPNEGGFFTEQDAEAAVMALYGQEIIGREKLQQTTKIQNTIKNSKPRSAVPRKAVEELPADVKEARSFKEYTQEAQKGGWTKG